MEFDGKGKAFSLGWLFEHDSGAMRADRNAGEHPVSVGAENWVRRAGDSLYSTKVRSFTASASVV